MGVVKGDNSLFFATGLDNSGLERGSADAVGIIRGLGSKIAKINPFAALAVNAAAAFGIIASGAYKMARNFEHAMKEVETISDATQKNFAGISKDVFALSKLTPDSPEKLAKAYYQIVSAGYDGAKGLKLLEVASKAAVAGVTDTETAADGITTVLNAFKIAAEDSEHVADIFFKTVQLGKTTFSELAANMSTVAPIASSMGIPFEQVAAAVASLTKQGTPTAQAMTQIRSALIGANEALGDGWAQALTLQEAFQLLYEEAGGRFEAVLGVAGANAKGAAKDLAEMAEAAGSSTDAFKGMSTSNINQIDILKNRIKATTKGIGDAVVDMANDIAGGLNSLFEGTDELVEKYDDQADKINELYQEYTTLNKEEARRLDIIEEIRKINPSLISDLEDQKDAYDNLGESVRAFNEFVLNKKLIDERFGSDIKNQKTLVNDTKEVTKKIAANLYEEYADFIKDLPKLGEAYQKELNKILDSDGDYLEKTKKIRELIIDRNGNLPSSNRITAPFGDLDKLKDYNKALEVQERILEKTKNKADEFQKALTDNSKSASFVIQEIEGIKTLKELYDRFGDFRTKSIVDAVSKQSELIKAQKVTQGEIKKINDITKEEYSKNKNILEFKSSGPKDDEQTFLDSLRDKKDKFHQYNLALEQGDLELAKKLKQNYKLKEDDYVAYLLNLLKATEDTYKKIEIRQELDKTNYEPRQVAQEVSAIKPAPIVVDVKLDVNSINSIKNRLDKLNLEYESAQTELERQLLADKIKAEEKRLEAAEKYRTEEQDLETDLVRHISDMSNRGLRAHIAALKKRVDAYKKAGKDITALEDEIRQSQEQIGSNTADTFSDVAGTLRDAGALFAKFGDEELAKVLDQMAGVADGAATLAAGIASNNPLAIISGGLQILDSALTVEIVSDTAKFEKAIKELEKAIDKLDYVISKSVGQDRVSSRSEAISELEELEIQAQKAREAELKARKETKFLGITIAKKGKGSGTDTAKLEELEQKAEDARRKAQELKEQLDELYTGTTEKTIVDSIISGLKEGKKSVADFANDFKSLIQDALLQAFQIKYLEKEIEKFYDLFADAGADGSYNSGEIDRLRNFYNDIINGAQNDLDAINEILEASGIGSLGSPDRQQAGLQGAIRREMTEETASELTGLFRGYYDISKQHFELAQQNLGLTNNIIDISERIANNTFETVEQLKLAVLELKDINENTEAIYLNDIG